MLWGRPIEALRRPADAPAPRRTSASSGCSSGTPSAAPSTARPTRSPRTAIAPPPSVGKGRLVFSTDGVTANFMFLTGCLGVLPLIYFYIPKSARAYLFPQSVKIHYFRSGPISVDPICPQSIRSRRRGPILQPVCFLLSDAIHIYMYTYIYIYIYIHTHTYTISQHMYIYIYIHITYIYIYIY